MGSGVSLPRSGRPLNEQERSVEAGDSFGRRSQQVDIVSDGFARRAAGDAGSGFAKNLPNGRVTIGAVEHVAGNAVERVAQATRADWTGRPNGESLGEPVILHTELNLDQTVCFVEF